MKISINNFIFYLLLFWFIMISKSEISLFRFRFREIFERVELYEFLRRKPGWRFTAGAQFLSGVLRFIVSITKVNISKFTLINFLGFGWLQLKLHFQEDVSDKILIFWRFLAIFKINWIFCYKWSSRFQEMDLYI